MSRDDVDRVARPGSDGVSWSVRIVDAATDEPLLDESGGVVLRTASAGVVTLRGCAVA